MTKIDVLKIRQNLSLTQGELANALGLTLRTIQNWESGKKIPKSKYALLRKLIIQGEEVKKVDEPVIKYTECDNCQRLQNELSQQKLEYNELNRKYLIVLEENRDYFKTCKRQCEELNI